MLNSNDLFNQIGLIVDPKNHYSYQSVDQYKTFLEIQLAQGQSYVLQIKQNDDPYQLAAKFCKTHQLNQLAVDIVQQKIIQAKKKQEEQFEMNKTKRNNSNALNQTNNNKLNRNTSISPAKKKLSKSPIKDKTPLKNNLNVKYKQNMTFSNNNKAKSVKNKGVQACQNLYFKGMILSRAQEEKRQKIKQQQEKKECEQLTFKPKINTVSQKIIEFRRQTGTTRPKQKKMSATDKIYDDLRQCTFQPTINKVSNLIVKNKGTYNNEYEHFNQLFKNQKSNKSNLIEKQQKKYFKPHLNTKKPFFVRLEKAIQLKKTIKDNDYQQYSFKPKVGRGPLQKNYKQNLPVWEHLSKTKVTFKQQTSSIEAELNQSKALSKVSSNAHYQNLIEKRVVQIFQLLDSDSDGIISPQNAAIQKLSRNSLIFLKPIFDQMDQLNAQLAYNQFKKAVINLLNDSDPHKKGTFLSQKQKKQSNQCSFSPHINKKSRDLMQCRSVSNIHKELYEQGLKQKQKKQYMLQKQRARREEQQLMQCSFKPSINISNNFYNSKVLAQKISGMEVADSFQKSQ